MVGFALFKEACPRCHSLYSYSKQPNYLKLNTPTEQFCSDCGDLVAEWSNEEIRVYVFMANAEWPAPGLDDTQLR
jgi:hypothetical protein